MSGPVAGEGITLLRLVREALGTREGRAIAREIAGLLRRADEEAAEIDPVGASVDEAIARATRQDRERAARRRASGATAERRRRGRP